MIRFAHIADCHVGAWRDQNMRELNLKYFETTINDILAEHKKKPIEFLLIAGDLFNTAIPSVEALKIVTQKLREIKDANIRTYGIAGSHDYSASGKSMLEVLEKAELFTNVMKGSIEDKKLTLDFTKDKSGIKIAGMTGKRGSLDQKQYQILNYDKIEKENGTKIFLFHAAIEEFKPDDLKNVAATSLSALPRNCLYLAGGHVHYRFIKQTLQGTICFPGPICPNSYKELLDLKHGSYIIGEIDEEKESEERIKTSECIKKPTIKLETKYIKLNEIKHILILADEKDPLQIHQQIKEQIIENHIKDKIILITLQGKMKSGTLSDIHLEELQKEMKEKGAYTILKNTTQLNTLHIEKEQDTIQDINEIEEEIIEKNIEESKLTDKKNDALEINKQKQLVKTFMNVLSYEKEEGETTTDFEERVIKDLQAVIEHEI